MQYLYCRAGACSRRNTEMLMRTLLPNKTSFIANLLQRRRGTIAKRWWMRRSPLRLITFEGISPVFDEMDYRAKAYSPIRECDVASLRLASRRARTISSYVASSLAARSNRAIAPQTKQKTSPFGEVFCFVGDPYGNRTHVTAVKGPCLNRLTNGPYGSGDWT